MAEDPKVASWRAVDIPTAQCRHTGARRDVSYAVILLLYFIFPPGLLYFTHVTLLSVLHLYSIHFTLPVL